MNRNNTFSRRAANENIAFLKIFQQTVTLRQANTPHRFNH